MDAGREVRVHALGQPLADEDPPGDDGVLHVGQQHPVQLGQGRDQVRPLRGVLKPSHGPVHLGHVAEEQIKILTTSLIITNLTFCTSNLRGDRIPPLLSIPFL